MCLLLVLTACSGKRKEAGRAPVGSSESRERLFVGFLSSLQGVPYDKAGEKMREWFDRYEKDTAMTAVVTRYLYDPSSPYRNEELYLPFVHGLALSEYTPDSLRQAYAYDERMCSLNRVNTGAADFEFETLGGQRLTLYGIRARYTLLLFSNPDCTACKDIMDALSANDVISGAILDGSLAVVNVYIDGDLAAWRRYAVNYPPSWHSGFDPHGVIRSDVLYNVRAIPSLYLLDEGKKVILKDAPGVEVDYYLTNALN